MSTITAIGFTNKYYTLWEISEETKPLGNGRSYINYSKDEIAKFGQKFGDMNLKNGW